MDYAKIRKVAFRYWNLKRKEQAQVFRELKTHRCDLDCSHMHINVYVYRLEGSVHYCCGEDYCSKPASAHSAEHKSIMRNVCVCQLSGKVHICDRNCTAETIRNADNMQVCSISKLQTQSNFYVASFEDGTAMPISSESKRNILNRNSNTMNRRQSRARVHVPRKMSSRNPHDKLRYMIRKESGSETLNINFSDAVKNIRALLFSRERWEYEAKRENDHIGRAQSAAKIFMKAELASGTAHIEDVERVYRANIVKSNFGLRLLLSEDAKELIVHHFCLLCMFSYCRMIKHDSERRIARIPFREFVISAMYMIDQGYLQESVYIFRPDPLLSKLHPDTGFVHRKFQEVCSVHFSGNENILKQIIPDIAKHQKVHPSSIEMVNFCLREALEAFRKKGSSFSFPNLLEMFAERTGYHSLLYAQDDSADAKRKLADSQEEFAKRARIADTLCEHYPLLPVHDSQRVERLLQAARDVL